eukprot:g9474.t1
MPRTFFECHAAHGVPGAETAQKDLADDAAALATLSPEVACVTVKGQKTYVVQFQEPVFKALPDVLKFHPLSSQLVSQGTDSFGLFCWLVEA